MITRKDIAEANAKLALGRKANLGLTTPSDRLVKSDGLPFIPYGACESTPIPTLLQPLHKSAQPLINPVRPADDPTVSSTDRERETASSDLEMAVGQHERNLASSSDWQQSRAQPGRRNNRRRDDGEPESSPLLDRGPGSGDGHSGVVSL